MALKRNTFLQRAKEERSAQETSKIDVRDVLIGKHTVQKSCSGKCGHQFSVGELMVLVANKNGIGKHGYYCQACGSQFR